MRRLSRKAFEAWLKEAPSETAGTSFTCPLATFARTQDVFLTNKEAKYYGPEWMRRFAIAVDDTDTWALSRERALKILRGIK